MSTVVCFGEVLWDALPQGLFLGGAPLNVAYHIHRLGGEPLLVSAVGEDALGEEVVERMNGYGLSTRYIGVRPSLRTGLVKVRVDSGGNASYRILDPVAWDMIDVPDALLAAAAPFRALVFGSLAMRHEHNLSQLTRLLSVPGVLRVFDVNLRSPFDNPELVFALSRHADVLKLNEEEIVKLTGIDTDPRESVLALSQRTGIQRICVTLAARGAILYDRGQWFQATAEPVEVRDTVGAGDAFLASLVLSMLSDRVNPADELARACRLGAFIASRHGATPEYDPSDVI